MIANSGHDEHGRYRNGTAGDQSGTEWAVIPWYSRPWNYVLRYPDSKVADELARVSRAAASNNRIGYDQNERTSYFRKLQAAGWDPARITENCEADCSAGVAANTIAVGFRVGIPGLQKLSPDIYTGNLRQAFKQAGFKVLTDPKYLTSDRYLKPGDVLLCEGHHVAVNLDYGSAVRNTERQESAEPHWKKDGSTYYYREAPGRNAHGWRLINHHWYYFDSKGKMLTGWQKLDGYWYFLDNTAGGPLEGALWHEVPGGKGALEIWEEG